MNIEQLVFDKVAETTGTDRSKLTRETTFLEVGADSLDMVEFSLDIEDALKITINQSDIAGIKTLGDAINFIEKNAK
jgi:acyl carrier protein